MRQKANLSTMGLRAQGSSSPSLSMASASALMWRKRSFTACLSASCSFSAASLICLQTAHTQSDRCMRAHSLPPGLIDLHAVHLGSGSYDGQVLCLKALQRPQQQRTGEVTNVCMRGRISAPVLAR